MPYRTDRAALAAPAIDDLIAARVADGHAPASSWALVTPDGVVATGGAADETVTPTPDAGTAFRVASCTKSFTAAALLQVVEDGGLDLGTPLDEVLDASVLGASRAPTLGELASMTGGIPIDDPWADRQESMATADLDAMLADGLRLVHEPGTRYEYSSYGYTLLGRVLERVTGTAYPTLVRERLIEPLGLTGIGFDRASVGAVAPGFARVEGAWSPQPWAEPGAFSPLGGVITSPSTLARWGSWLAAAFADGASDAVLPAARRRGMQQPHAAVPDGGGTAYGFGLVVDEHPRHGRIVHHSGGYPGYGANMRWHPRSGIGVVVLESARYSGASLPAAAALRLVLEAAWAPEEAPDLWAATRDAREVVERSLRRWDDDAIAAIASDNLALDESFALRRAAARRLADRIGLAPDDAVLPLADAAPASESPAHLAWSVPGRSGSLRCEIRLTPLRRPTLQTLAVRLG